MTPEPTTTPVSPPAGPEENLFRYGWRYVPRTLPDGRETLDQIPLTLEDVLHPQEEDVIPERPQHNEECGYLFDTFTSRLPGLNQGLVLSDCLVDWGVPPIRDHSPDISVFEEVRVPHDPNKGTLRLRPSGGRCVLAIELVSPDRRDNDVVAKFDEYYRVGVPLYIIVDQEDEDAPRKLLAYEHTPDGYALVPLTEQGRVELPRLGLCMGLEDDWVVCYDTITGEKLGRYSDVLDERKKAQQQARDEAKARTKAEEQARKAADERKKAQQKARKETGERKKAELKAREEADLRTKAEQKLQELEAELRRLRDKKKT